MPVLKFHESKGFNDHSNKIKPKLTYVCLLCLIEHVQICICNPNQELLHTCILSSGDRLQHLHHLKFSNIYLHISLLYWVHFFSVELDLIIIKHSLENRSIKWVSVFKVYHTLNLMLPKIHFDFYFLAQVFCVFVFVFFPDKRKCLIS